VIIPVYNAEKFIKETIESVLEQTYQDFEIIIIDDGSTDKSAEVIKSFDDKRIIYTYQKNQGVSATRNIGILKSNGEYIALLDHDDLWLPEKLERQIPILESNSNVGLVYSDCYIIALNGNILGRNFKDHRPHRGKVLPDLFLDNFIPCLTAVIRKNILNHTKFFNPELSIAEEYDLFLRIARSYEIEYIDLPLAEYRIHETNFSKDAVSAYEEENTLVKTFLERHPGLRDVLSNKVDKRLAAIYYNLGKAYFFQGEVKKSRCFLDKAIKTYMAVRPFLFKLLTFLGYRFVEKLRKLKRSIVF